MKPEARVFEISSPTTKISLNLSFEYVSELKYCLWYAESVIYLMLAGF